uniref:Autophagy-related protein n=1 Tax=Steinernema glaseri TaxID=37863 RepID=A0A1I7ZNP9_9BILA
MSSESAPATKVTRPYKERHSLEERKKLAKTIFEKNPDHVPVILERAAKSQLKEIKGCRKVIISANFSASRLLMEIRRKIELQDHESVFIFFGNGNALPSMTMTLGELHKMYADEDGFLYVNYYEESVYGN